MSDRRLADLYEVVDHCASAADPYVREFAERLRRLIQDRSPALTDLVGDRLSVMWKAERNYHLREAYRLAGGDLESLHQTWRRYERDAWPRHSQLAEPPEHIVGTVEECLWYALAASPYRFDRPRRLGKKQLRRIVVSEIGRE
jgi:hypothetical protein